MTQGPDFYNLITERIEKLFKDVEQSRNTLVAPFAITFMREIIIESVALRSVEWKDNFGLDSYDALDYNNIIDCALSKASKILHDATIDEYNGKRYILLVNIIKSIHTDYCDIFPFCK